MGKNSPPLNVTLGGFYDAAGTANLTAIVANGQNDFVSILNLTSQSVINPNNGNATSQPLSGQTSFDTFFKGVVGARWDAQPISVGLSQHAASYSLTLTPNTPQTCLTPVSFWTSVEAVDTDKDGLLDNWEKFGMHFGAPVGTPGVIGFQQATFGGCAGPNDTTADCVNLPAMGANNNNKFDFNRKDILIEFD